MATLDSIEAVISAYVAGFYEAWPTPDGPRDKVVKQDCVQWMCDYAGVRYGEALERFGADTLDYIDTEISRQARF